MIRMEYRLKNAITGAELTDKAFFEFVFEYREDGIYRIDRMKVYTRFYLHGCYCSAILVSKEDEKWGIEKIWLSDKSTIEATFEKERVQEELLHKLRLPLLYEEHHYEEELVKEGDYRE